MSKGKQTALITAAAIVAMTAYAATNPPGGPKTADKVSVVDGTARPQAASQAAAPPPTAPAPANASPAFPTSVQARPGIYLGADMSYVNTLEGCGLVYRYNDAKADPFDLLKRYGGNVVRVRLFVNPAASTHGDLADAVRTIKRAKAAGLKVQLDLHYSDYFTDPGHQLIPAAWAGLTQTQLETRVHDYTYKTLTDLSAQGLMPELVQVGNETNGNIIVANNDDMYPLNWDRSRPLFNAAIRGVREAGQNSSIKPKVILHVSGPENIDWWFGDATTHGVTDFDIIGVSYYAHYSSVKLQDVGGMIKAWKAKYKKDVMIVETAYPFTFDYADNTNNINYTESLVAPYEASPAGQRDYMAALTQIVLDSGGIGVVSWEPFWSAVPCDLGYVQGSTWENVTYFDWRTRNNVHAGITWLGKTYKLK